MPRVLAERVEMLRWVEKVMAVVGLAAGVAAAVYTYVAGDSYWLAAFVFIMLTRFLMGCVPKLVYHDHRLRRLAFYALWPGFGTLILYGVYQWLGRMWLAMIAGLLGGMIASVYFGLRFFYQVAEEDRQREKDIAHFQGTMTMTEAAQVGKLLGKELAKRLDEERDR